MGLTLDGRLRQANRMKKIADEFTKQWVILDFICPLVSYRNIINADVKIFMNTISESRYNNTDKIFEKTLEENDYNFDDYNSDYQSDLIIQKIRNLTGKRDCSDVR